MIIFAVIFTIWIVLLFLYMLAIMPRMILKPDYKPFLEVLYAHRGFFDNASNAPENSLSAFQKAVDLGYGIELDVQLTKDQIPVVFHDFTLNRACGIDGKVEAFTYEELQKFRLFKSEEKIPSFQEVLKVIGGKVPIIVELKMEGKDLRVCSQVDAILREYKGLCCIESFNPLGLMWYRKHNRKVLRGQLADSFQKDLGEKYKSFLYVALENLWFNFLAKPDFIAYNHVYYKNFSRCICRYVYGGLSVAWTIRSQEELEARKEDFDLFIFESFVPKNVEKID